jgi:hypothetical protein
LLWCQNSFAQKAGSVQEDDIREAIVRYQIANWDLRADVYFVEIQSKDPTKEFLLRFADIPKPVEKKSASRIRKEVVGNYVEERHTKTRGVVFDQESIVRISDSRVDVRGGYYCASLCMAGGVYHLERLKDHWVVTDFRAEIMA